jgi:hypothetical protein
VQQEGGQASVSLLATLPALLLASALLAQIALIGYAAWSAGNAARAAARAAHIGADPEAAARAALPGGLRRAARTELGEGRGEVRVDVRPVRLLGALPTPRVGASAALEPGAG